MKTQRLNNFANFEPNFKFYRILKEDKHFLFFLKYLFKNFVDINRPWWLSWLRRLSTNSKVEGSNPGGGIRIYFRDSRIINAHDRARTRMRMRKQERILSD